MCAQYHCLIIGLNIFIKHLNIFQIEYIPNQLHFNTLSVFIYDKFWY